MDLLRPNSPDAWRQRAGRVLRPATLAMMVCVAYVAVTASQSGGLTEYEVKAAFLFNFIKFVEWPASAFANAGAPIVLGVLGEDPFGSSLDLIVEGQFVQGRDIAIRRYRFGDDVGRCHVLFVSTSEQARAAHILKGLQGASLLTVSDIAGFAQKGGVVQFYMQEDRVRFLVNVEAAAQARLRVSAKLLALAHVLKEAPGVR